jgi:hypothetical protein
MGRVSTKCWYAGVCIYGDKDGETASCNYFTITEKLRTASNGVKDPKGALIDGKCGYFECRKGKEKPKLTAKAPKPRPVCVNPDDVRALHAKGMTVPQIATELRFAESTIRDWHRRLKLKPNLSSEYGKMSATFQELYDQGFTDEEIEEKTGYLRKQVKTWRLHEGLKSNSISRYELESRERMKLYLDGLTDEQIAKQRGFSPKTIECWRYKHDLPANHKEETADD